MLSQLPFRCVVVADTEYEFGGHDTFEDAGRSGERPRPVCLCAKELRSGQTWQLWRGEFDHAPPFPIGADSLFVAYAASAEIGTFLALGWPKPANILDLYFEFRNITNGYELPAGRGLIGALAYFGLDTIGATEKEHMRKLILRGGPWSNAERAAIISYCDEDVAALERLFPAMLPRIDWPRALLRGRYAAAVAAMEATGIPIDVPTLRRLRAGWTGIQDQLIAAIDSNYGVFDGRSFRAERWARYLTEHNISWPLLDSGRLDLSRDTFREMARSHPAVAPMRELRSALSEMRLNDLAVGRDGRNRASLFALATRTGRNAPSNTKFVFGPSTWLRGLIKASPGHAIAHVDWSNQEFGIAAAQSNDLAMQDAYRSGDPYLATAKLAGSVPADATKETHAGVRQLFKAVVLGVQYGMEAATLSARIGQPAIVARHLLNLHRQTFPQFWRWSDAAVDHAVLHGSLHTVFGWQIYVTSKFNPRSLRNFPMQANGAEMMRVASCLATENGIEVCCPVHDSFLICAPLDRIEADVAKMCAFMVKASRIVLGGFELRIDAEILAYPDRYMDPRGEAMWKRVMELLDKQQTTKEVAWKTVATHSI